MIWTLEMERISSWEPEDPNSPPFFIGHKCHLALPTSVSPGGHGDSAWVESSSGLWILQVLA